MLAEGQEVEGISDIADESVDEPALDRVLSAPWTHRGTVEAAVVLKCGDRPVKRRRFVFLTGATLTAPAHQWLVADPGPLVSGLAATAQQLIFNLVLNHKRRDSEVLCDGAQIFLCCITRGNFQAALDSFGGSKELGRKRTLSLLSMRI